MSEKQAVAIFWEEASCGEELYLAGNQAEDYRTQACERYRLEPYIIPFLEAESWNNKLVLEVGVGLGADHELLAEKGARLSGIDLTDRAIEHAKRRLALKGLVSDLRVGDAENLPFPDASFDMVYSWGVIHHSPDTGLAAREILRVLKPGGVVKVMIYHKWSLIGLMLWVRYALLIGKPFRSLDQIYSNYLESPGTKAYTESEAANLFAGATVSTRIVLTHGDLLEGAAGQRHRGVALDVVRKLWPRWFFRRYASGYGLFLLIEGRKES